jgi:predicted RNase H-like nuclease (RuvC/YqgF family)
LNDRNEFGPHEMSANTSYEEVLEEKLGAARARIAELERENAKLLKEVERLKRILGALENAEIS